MSLATFALAPLAPTKKGRSPLPLHKILRVIETTRKAVFSRKLYLEINDKILANTSTLDANLYFICYATLLASLVLDNKHHIRAFLAKQRHNLLIVLQKSLKTLFDYELKVKASAPPSSPQQQEKPKSSGLAVHLKQISSYLSDIRIFNRLTDSIKYVPWIVDEFSAFKSGPGPRLDRFVNLLQSLNCLVLELLENAGWLTDHNWVGTSDNPYWCIETYIWCSRVWGAYLLIEIVELIRRTPVSKWDKNWKIALFQQVIQVPLVVHWSLYEGCLSPFWVGVCGSGASWWGFRKTWKSISLD